MKISAKLNKPVLDMSKYRSLLREQLTEAARVAALHWLTAVSNAIPCWSGASRGTLQHVASQLGRSVDINIAGSAPSDRTGLGIASSSGGIVLDQADAGRVSFHYSTTLPHLIWNEFNNANITPDPTKWRNVKLKTPGPYHFQEKGMAEVKAALKGLRLPDPRSCIYVTSAQV